MASTSNADRSLSNGSQPPDYDAAVNQTSLPPSQPYAQRPIMMAQAPPVFTPPVLGMQHPSYDGPADFFILVMVTTIVCGLLNLTSLVFGAIALVMASTARNKNAAYDYRSAQQYSVAAVALSFCNIIWTFAWATAIIGSVYATRASWLGVSRISKKLDIQ